MVRERRLRKAAVMSKSMLSAVIAVVLLTQASAAERALEQLPKFTDSRDNKTYRKVTIGKQTWMAENLNYAAEGSKCYENNAGNCEKYGRLYNWSTAKGACPAGWHLPSDAEWDVLTVAVGGVKDEDGDWQGAGKKLKSAAGWNEDGNGTNEFAFSALPGGIGASDGSFYAAGDNGCWWSATQDGAPNAWYRYMHYSNEVVYRDDGGKSFLFAVRCVQDQ